MAAVPVAPVPQKSTPAGEEVVARRMLEGWIAAWNSHDAGRASALLADPRAQVMIMGNHGVLVIGDNVGDAFNRMFYFERAAETYIKALWTGRPLRVLSDAIAEKTEASDLVPDVLDRSVHEHVAEAVRAAAVGV